ncbi:YegP family protein [Sphingomonas kyungheensis]
MAKRPFPSYYIYKDEAGEYRWRYQAVNGKILADSGEGYVTKKDCRHGLDQVRKSGGDPVWKAGDVEDD